MKIILQRRKSHQLILQLWGCDGLKCVRQNPGKRHCLNRHYREPVAGREGRAGGGNNIDNCQCCAVQWFTCDATCFM